MSGQRFLKLDKGLQICGLGLQIELTDSKIVGTVSRICEYSLLISDPFLTKRINYLSSPAQTRTFQTVLHCTSLKPE